MRSASTQTAPKASQDDPRQETIAELLRRKTGKAIGVVSDAEIEDATPASVVAHTRRRSDKADIVGMFYEVRPEVIFGRWLCLFPPAGYAWQQAQGFNQLS